MLNPTVLGFIPVVLIVIAVVAIVMTGYVKAPPDKAYIISGTGKKKILIGKAGVCIPLLNRKDELLLRQISVDIKTGGSIPTRDFIGVTIDAVAKVAVMSGNEMVEVLDQNGDKVYPEGSPHAGKRYKLVPGIELAMKNFLNMNEAQIIKALTDSLQGNMREIIGTMDLRIISSDRKAFGDQVQEKAQSDMNNLGIKIISCNIQSVIDDNGLINALGQDNMSKIQKDAAIAKAEAERDVAIKQAETSRESNDARVAAQLEIAKKNNELELRKSELKKTEDTKKAEADAAYDIQKQVQMKEINTETVNAQIAQAEREADLKTRTSGNRRKQISTPHSKELRPISSEGREKQKQLCSNRKSRPQQERQRRKPINILRNRRLPVSKRNMMRKQPVSQPRVLRKLKLSRQKVSQKQKRWKNVQRRIESITTPRSLR